ncbi:uncharacterized protein [Hyperolius riggenbachi]|uniref:uncharacterized protein n=1 Tax=Hyperolius riggenbachi TaxID=752182 RepID=UPI0035A2C813
MERRSLGCSPLLLIPALLLSLAVLSAAESSGSEYIQTGSNITQCDMKCRNAFDLLMLYRRCGGKEEERLLQLDCNTNYTIWLDPRYHLNISSGCWTLPQAGRGDSCVYEVRDRGAGDKVLTSTYIRVLDPVLIYNISSNSSRLGEDIAVTVQFSGEESHVTWELDGGRLPERYRLIDDNRTLIIPSVQRDDAERTFRVRVTNPVSEEVRDYRLEITEPSMWMRSHISIVTAVSVALLVGLIICIIHLKRRQRKANRDEEKPAGLEMVIENNNDCHQTEDGYTPVVQDDPVLTAENGSTSVTAKGCTPIGQDGPVLTAENGSTSVTAKGCTPIGQDDPVQTAYNGSTPVAPNGYNPIGQDGSVQTADKGSTPVILNGYTPIPQDNSAPITQLQ